MRVWMLALLLAVPAAAQTNTGQIYEWDVSLMKNFPIYGTARMTLRADVFNVFNRVNFDDPETTVTDDDFGAISEAKIPRQMQISLRFEF